MIALREIAAVARLDFGEVRRSRWLVFSASVYGFFALACLFVAMRESSIIGFTGAQRILISLSHALVLVLPLLALTASCQVVNRSRDDGTLEVLFSHPLSRTGYLVGVSVTRYAVLVVPLAATLIAFTAYGTWLGGGAGAWRFALRTICVSGALTWAGVGIGLAISVLARDQAKALVAGLVVWAVGVALLDFVLVGMLLQWHLNARVVFLLAALNPVEGARLALLAGAQPDLASFGPVGFYLASRLGPRAMFAAGALWPACCGSIAWLVAWRSFRRGDAV
jgi:ABC-type transport system involved in multi-copper enzyme maturation permease subunit